MLRRLALLSSRELGKAQKSTGFQSKTIDFATWKSEFIQKRSLILRRLDRNEIKVVKDGIDSNIVGKVRITSKVNLFDNVELLKKSILIWKEEYKFLSTQVITHKDELYFDLIEDEPYT